MFNCETGENDYTGEELLQFLKLMSFYSIDLSKVRSVISADFEDLVFLSDGVVEEARLFAKVRDLQKEGKEIESIMSVVDSMKRESHILLRRFGLDRY